jgi:F0F1-type ATP synthase epsilon subunit
MADHEPLMGALVTGPVTVEDEAGNRTTIGVHGGFIQVLHNQVTLITDRAQIAGGGKEEGRELAEELAAAPEE